MKKAVKYQLHYRIIMKLKFFLVILANSILLGTSTKNWNVPKEIQQQAKSLAHLLDSYIEFYNATRNLEHTVDHFQQMAEHHYLNLIDETRFPTTAEIESMTLKVKDAITTAPWVDITAAKSAQKLCDDVFRPFHEKLTDSIEYFKEKHGEYSLGVASQTKSLENMKAKSNDLMLVVIQQIKMLNLDYENVVGIFTEVDFQGEESAFIMSQVILDILKDILGNKEKAPDRYIEQLLSQKEKQTFTAYFEHTKNLPSNGAKLFMTIKTFFSTFGSESLTRYVVVVDTRVHKVKYPRLIEMVQNVGEKHMRITASLIPGDEFKAEFVKFAIELIKVWENPKFRMELDKDEL